MKKPHIPVRFVPIGATILVFLLAYAIGIANFRNFGSLASPTSATSAPCASS